MHPTTADNVGKLILRIVLSLLILLHGIAKIPTGAAGLVEGFGFIAYGVFIGEIIGPVLLLIGWHARIGAALIVINMLAAVALVHSGELFMLNEHGGYQLELQAMFLFSALALAFTGPGKLSLNQK